MGGRYIISGTQIGTLLVLIEKGKTENAIKLLNEISSNQYLGEKEDLEAFVNDLNDIKEKIKPLMEKLKQ